MNGAVPGLLAAGCGVLGLRGVTLLRARSDVERRELHEEIDERRRRRGARTFERIGRRLGPLVLARMSERRRAAISRRLDLAGRPGGMNLTRYAELRASWLLVGGIIAAWLIIAGDWLVGLALLLFATLAVDVWLSRSGRLRQERLERDLPDFIDILSITVRAGTSYRTALSRVAGSLGGPPGEEILSTLRQMDLGATRREAFGALRARNSCTALDSFVAAQLQAEELGVPLADALMSIAGDMRRSAGQNARRRAQRATPRVSLIAATILLPATMLLIVVGLFIGSGIDTSGILG